MHPRMSPHLRGRYVPHGQPVPWWGRSQQSHRPRSRYYTAMCVRMCDGFYYPLSHRATRSKFHDLAKRCETSCSGGEARLFYMRSGGDVARMTDLTGRAYEHIDTAFLYRKTLVKSCTCKPMPWSYSARSKHAQYAADAAEKRMQDQEQQRQQVSLAPHSSTKKPGRTIIESLDDATTIDNTDGGDLQNASDQIDDPVGSDQVVQRPRKRTYRIRKRRRHRMIRARRPRPPAGWTTAVSGGKVRYVRPGYRVRRRKFR